MALYFGYEVSAEWRKRWVGLFYGEDPFAVGLAGSSRVRLTDDAFYGRDWSMGRAA
jgi:hypothetical protein